MNPKNWSQGATWVTVYSQLWIAAVCKMRAKPQIMILPMKVSFTAISVDQVLLSVKFTFVLTPKSAVISSRQIGRIFSVLQFLWVKLVALIWLIVKESEVILGARLYMYMHIFLNICPWFYIKDLYFSIFVRFSLFLNFIRIFRLIILDKGFSYNHSNFCSIKVASN